MTYEEAVSLANSGDIGAMYTLGNFHFQKDEPQDAFEWFSKAADLGFTLCAALAALSGFVHSHICLTTFKNTPFCDKQELAAILEKVHKYSLVALESDQVEEQTKEAIRNQLPDVLYYRGFCLYAHDKMDEAYAWLRENLSRLDEKGKVLYGVCGFEIALDDATDGNTTVSLVNEAYPLLKLVDRTEINDDTVLYAAYLYLSIAYRIGEGLYIKNHHNDIGKAREYILTATQRIKDEDYLNLANKQLAHYKKKLLGGYTFVD